MKVKMPVQRRNGCSCAQVIKDSQLIAMVAVLLLVDVLLLLSWTLFARRDVDKIDLPQLVRCHFCHCLMHTCTESSIVRCRLRADE